jgi:hypothetical protein
VGKIFGHRDFTRAVTVKAEASATRASDAAAMVMASNWCSDESCPREPSRAHATFCFLYANFGFM